MLVAVLFAFPSQVPFEMDDDLNDDVQFEISNFFHADKVDENPDKVDFVHVINPSSVSSKYWAVDFDRYQTSLF